MGWTELSQTRFKQLIINTCSLPSSMIRGALNTFVRFLGGGVRGLEPQALLDTVGRVVIVVN